MSSSLLTGLGEKALIAIIVALAARIIFFFKKPLLNYFKNRLGSLERNFYRSVAQRNRYGDHFKLLLIASIVGFGSVLFPFFEKQREFQLLKLSFDTANAVHDSIYHRAIMGKLKFVDNYDAEVEDVKLSMGIRKVPHYKSRSNASIAMIEHDMISPMKVSFVTLTVITKIFEYGLYAIAGLIGFILIRIRVRDEYIKDFEWKLSLLHGIETELTILGFRRQWANIKSSKDHVKLMKEIQK